MKNKKFWNWAGEGNSRELRLYGTIAPESWYDDDVTPKMFRDELMRGEGPITVWLNSCGGDCVAASQIYAMLIDYPYDVTVKIDGVAASAASVVAMAGTHVLMSPTACLMIHDPMTAAVGSAADMEKAIAMLTSVKDSIIDAYQIKTGLDRKTLARMMSEETWMDCRKAIELGFADGVLEKTTPSFADNAEPVLFSQRAVDRALVNRMKDTPSGGVSSDISLTDSVPIEPLYARLNRLRNDIYPR